MGCFGKGTTDPARGVGNFMFREDPQNLPGQGLMRADNYNAVRAGNEYAHLVQQYGKQAQPLYDIESQWTPQYAQLNANAAQIANQGMQGLYGQNVNQGVGMMGYAPGLVSGLEAADPSQAALMNLLSYQAGTDLLAGSRLNPEEQRYMQQASREAMAARGLGGSNAAIADELFRQYDLGQTRLNQRRAFAGNVAQMRQQAYSQPVMNWLALQQQLGNARSAAAWDAGGQALAQFRQIPTNWLSMIYGENQANNRATAANETQMALKAAEELSSLGGMLGGMGG